jgi:DNA-binding NtrC family response regulator
MSEQKPVLIVVDDDRGVLDVIGRFASRSGFEVVACPSGRDALAQIDRRPADVALVDMRMPEMDGFDVLRAIRQRNRHCETVMMTGFASVDSAVEAIKLGACDYLAKPVDFSRLGELLDSARDRAGTRRASRGVDAGSGNTSELHGMIGHGPAMQNLFALVRRLAPHVRTALITGETGTGKELVARVLHAMGPGVDKTFLTLNCSAVDETLLEGELFGHVPGALPGALESRAGLLEQADGGSIFLDDVGELPAAMQAKLLQTLQLGEVHRVGSLESRRVDVRVLASTHEDLRAAVQAGRFRGDLFYRLNAVDIRLPPLRDRREDIPHLAAWFVREAGKSLNKPLVGLTSAADSVLSACPWEGNIRELRSVVERACILSDGEVIDEQDISRVLPDAPPPGRDGNSDPQLLTTVERDHIQRALQRAHGNKKAAAKMLGLSRRALYRRLERLDLAATITRRPLSGAGSLSL